MCAFLSYLLNCQSEINVGMFIFKMKILYRRTEFWFDFKTVDICILIETKKIMTNEVKCVDRIEEYEKRMPVRFQRRPGSPQQYYLLRVPRHGALPEPYQLLLTA